jgi:hypothetical protein
MASGAYDLVLRDLHPRRASIPAYRVFDPAFHYLFNSYYEAEGPRHPRPQRGVLSRPSCADVAAYRDHVGAAMARLIEGAAPRRGAKSAPLIELGLSSRAAASGADPDGHQARVLAEPAAAGLSAAAPARAGNRGAARVGRVSRRAREDRP